MLRINNYYLSSQIFLFHKSYKLQLTSLLLLFTISAFCQGPPPPEPGVRCFPPLAFSNFTYAGNSEKYDNVQDSNFREIRFSEDGTKMFILGLTSNFIEQHSVQFPFDISSASLDNEEGFSVNNEETAPTGFAFSTDGLKLFVVGTSSQRVHPYTLSSAYDISSAVYDGMSASMFVGDRDNSPQGIAFNTLEHQLLVLGGEHQKVIQYNLSAAFDVSSPTYNAEYSLPSGMNATSLDYSRTGSDMYILDENTNKILRYFANIADISNSTFRGELDLSATETSAKGFDYIYPRVAILGSDNDAVLEFNSDLPAIYLEANANDGTIMTNSNPTIYRLVDAVGNKFIDADDDGILDTGVNITNLPSGLNAVFTLNGLKNEAILQLTGTAVNHDDSDDVYDIGISFTQDSHDISLPAYFSCQIPIVIDFKENTLGVDDYLSSRVQLFTDDSKNLHIRTSEVNPREVRIYNLLGQEVFDTANFNPSTNEHNFTVNLKDGIYIVKLVTDSGEVAQKIIFN